jgi:hypothetical protein
VKCRVPSSSTHLYISAYEGIPIAIKRMIRKKVCLTDYSSRPHLLGGLSTLYVTFFTRDFFKVNWNILKTKLYVYLKRLEITI